MRRAHGHLVFVIAAAAFGALSLSELVRLQNADKVNAAIAQWAPRAMSQPVSDARTQPAMNTRPTVLSSPTHLLPEARLAYAVALSRVDYDGALATYKAAIQSNRQDLRRIALYDLGNLHLRQALQVGLSDEAQAVPLLELAKQSYRDSLRADPNDWDARYNLERTLRLAPEDDEDDEDSGPPSPNEHERSTIADPRMDLP